MTRTVSGDGTPIAFGTTGRGPALLLVDPPLRYRRNSLFQGLVPLLSENFTVVTYDRRGRGDSGDTAPYAPAREVEDIAAIISSIGGTAFVYGFSGGALLALHAAAAGVGIAKLAVLEPPLREAGAPVPDPLTVELAAILAEGRKADAVVHFHDSIGVPAEVIAEIRNAPGWDEMVAVAPTLLHDCAISEATTPDVLRRVAVPTLVLDSSGSTDNLAGWAATVAALIPGATHRSLPGEWHVVADDVLAPALRAFFLG